MAPNSADDDRRADPRIPGRVEVRFDQSGDAARALKAYSVNVSRGGLCLKTQRTYAVGTRLGLTMTVEGGQTFDLEAVVAWARGGAIGLRFENVSDVDRARLTHLAETLGRAGGEG